jgi:hypothetical protein
MTTVPLSTDLAEPLVRRLWETYGPALTALDRAGRMARVADLIAPFGPDARETEMIQMMVEDRVRDHAAPADTPTRRGVDRLFR